MAVVAAAKVDGDAFTTLYQHYRQPIFYYCQARALRPVAPFEEPRHVVRSHRVVENHLIPLTSTLARRPRILCSLLPGNLSGMHRR